MRAQIDIDESDGPVAAIPVSPIKLDLDALKSAAPRRLDRLRYPLILTLCLAAHASILLLLDPAPQPTRVEEAIPVEIIIEPPPPEEPVKAPEPTPEQPKDAAAQTIDEPPAQDFARAADQDREDGKATEQASSDQKPDPPPPEPQPPADPQPEAAAPRDAPQAATPEALPPDPSSVEPAPAEKPAPQLAPQPPKPAKAPVFSSYTPTPEFRFAEPLAKRSDGPRGTAQPGYLSTVYGKIMGKMPRLPKPARPARGRVTFGITSNGRIFSEAIAIPSGEPFLDAAALGAVRKAAPLPPPPQGGPVYLRFDYGSD